jgi:hypothetical protein
MIDYKDLKALFQLLKVKSVFEKHWFDTSRWGMVKVMHVVLLEVTKTTFFATPFIVVNANEVTMIDNTQWLSIHLYVVQKWKCIPILLCVEAINLFATFDNIFSLMVKCMLYFGGLGVEELVGKLVSIGSDKSSIFQGHRTCMTTQIKDKVAPFITRMLVLPTEPT